MNFDQLFEPRLELIRSENRYRAFADLERCAGHFPQAFDHRLQDQVTVWCSNDYLGMGQRPVVLAAMHEAIDRVGAGGSRNIAKVLGPENCGRSRSTKAGALPAQSRAVPPI